MRTYIMTFSMSQVVKHNQCIWYCGFNAFKQNKILDTSSRNDSIDKVLLDDDQLMITSPVGINTVKTHGGEDFSYCALTWSKIVLISDTGAIYTSGHKSHNTEKSVFREARCITTCGENIIVLDKSGTLYMVNDKMENGVKKLTAECERLKTTIDIEGTEKQCFFLQDDGTVGYMDIDSHSESGNHINLMGELRTGGTTIKQLSCGKEHVILLDENGCVYSYGGGSRGQLGHGTVDNKKEPTIIKSLEGLKMSSVAAGGWHSVSVSEEGDVYVWGWNESGQLGLPATDVHTLTSCDTPRDTSCDTPCDTSSEISTDTKTRSTSDSKIVCESIQSRCTRTDCSVSRVTDHKPGTDIDSKTSKITEKFTDSQNHARSNICPNKLQCDYCHVDCVDQHHASNHTFGQLEDSYSKIFIQNIESVQVQMYPVVLDLVEDVSIKKVSCGSRHTAMITDNGKLLTCGWNSYGQLCHGDTCQRDYLQTVAHFTRNKITVTDIFCGHWSTVVVSN